MRFGHFLAVRLPRLAEASSNILPSYLLLDRIHPRDILFASSRLMRRSTKCSDMSAADDNPQPLACFASLPYELRAKVVSMAYSCDPYFPWLPPGFAQSLALVSRDVHSIITPILYKHVRLERPSKLRSFLSTLVARPALGRLVKSLHLGAACHLHHEWWPLNFFGAADDEVELEEITTSSYDKGKLPRWTELDRGWSFVQPETDAGLKQRDKAVLSAIKVAQRELNITLQSPHVVLNREENGQLLWLIGVLEIQAVLDLYLYEMRRLEDAAGLYMTPRNGSVPVEDEISLESPPLVLEWTSPPAASSSKTSPSPTGSLGQPKPFVISRTRLLQHLYRPGGPADCFDHPLIFARSGMQVLDFDLAGQARSSDKFLAQMTSLCYDDADKGSSDAAPFALPRAAGAVPYAPDLTVALDVAANGTFTVGGILALARSLLALTPRVENLFLSGFLQAAFCGTEAAFVPSLRWLCLGPLSLFSDESFPPSLLDGSRFPNLEHVRFMGSGFDERKRACIATLPRLETVEWAMENSIEPDER